MPIYQLNQFIPNIAVTAWVAPNAIIIGQVTLAENSSVWWSAVIRGDTDQIYLGKNSNVQDGSVLHTDHGIKLIIGDNVTLGHQVMCHGCTIGNNCLIGIGAVILNNAVIGENCLVAAHSLVPEGKTYPAGSLIMGSPAKVVRQLNENEIIRIKYSAEHYVVNSKQYQQNLILLN